MMSDKKKSAPRKKVDALDKQKKAKQNQTRRRSRRSKIKGQEGRNNLASANTMQPKPFPAPMENVGQSIAIKVAPCIEGIQSLVIPPVIYSLMMGAENTAANPIYWAYYYMINDLIALLGTGVGTASRLRYLNYVYASLIPKTIPFGKVGKLNYTWLSVQSISPVKEIVCRGQRTSMFVLNNSAAYVAPVNPGNDEAAASSYAAAMAKVYTNANGNTTFERDVTLKGDLEHDTSAFSRIAPYHGQGASQCYGWWATSESEGPFRASGLSLSFFQPTENRSSRFITSSSGDPCLNYNIGLLNVPLSLYKTAFPIVLKAVDFDEVFYVFQLWLERISQSAAQTGAVEVLGSDGVPAFTFPSLEPSGFWRYAVAFRQILLRFFFAQANLLGQFMQPVAGNNVFEAFRMGTNSAPIGQWENLTLPVLLNENLKMLSPALFSQAKGDKFRRDKNGQLVIPVLGRYPANIVPQAFTWGQIEGSPGQVIWEKRYFGGAIAPSPPWNLIEVSESNILQNANDGDIMIQVKFLNDFIARYKQFSSPTVPCGGNPPVSCRLPLTTRYNKFLTNSIDLGSSMMANYLVRKGKDKNLVRRGSKGSIVYAPAGADLTTERDIGISSYFPLTNDMHQLLNFLIIPTIEIDVENDNSVSIEQIQTETREYCATQTTNQLLEETALQPSRAARLAEYAENMATGLAAGSTDSVTNYVEKLSVFNEGSFFSDLFGTVSSIAGSLGI